MQEIKERSLPIGPGAISKAASTSGVIVEATNDDTYGYDVYLSSVGTGIDPSANANAVTMRFRVNRQPFYPLQAMSSQIGSIVSPQQFNPPIYLGRGCIVDIFGEVDGTAVGNTTLAGMFVLKLVKP